MKAPATLSQFTKGAFAAVAAILVTALVLAAITVPGTMLRSVPGPVSNEGLIGGGLAIALVMWLALFRWHIPAGAPWGRGSAVILLSLGFGFGMASSSAALIWGDDAMPRWSDVARGSMSLVLGLSFLIVPNAAFKPSRYFTFFMIVGGVLIFGLSLARFISRN